MANKIKLVIWDLDNTLWSGTLAEGDAPILLPGRAELIKTLTAAGVVNSICSKNNFTAAKEILSRLGLWDHFVFPKIVFAPKGHLVQNILDEMHLRAANAVFIDDEPTNLQEVLYYNPQITVLHASDCEKFFAEIPVDDSAHSRLEQYKQLERKQQEKNFFASNEDFLRNSNICLEIIPVTDDLFGRLCELTERTNQLNFTKNRMTPEELQGLLKNPNVETRLIHVTDNFGDYGYIGFYSLYQGNLIHFVFSCRIMNMGIEHFVYQYLGYPKIQVKGDTASKLSRGRQIDYIKILSGDTHKHDADSIENILTEESQINIFALGACDLYHAVAYLALPNNYFFYECNVFVGNERGVNVGTEYIRSQIDMTDNEKNFCRQHFYNYTRHNVFKSEIFNRSWDYVILSFHDDMVFKIYEHKNNPNLRVVLSPEKVFGLTSVINISDTTVATYDEQSAWLAKNFNAGHFITPERFEENLLWIASRLPAKTKIILINGPELDFFREQLPHCPEVRAQIFALNKVIKRVCETYAGKFALVDMNQIVRSLNDVTNYIFHLKAETAFALFAKIFDTMKKITSPLRDKPNMLHKVLGGRKVCVFGKNPYNSWISVCDLFLGGVNVSAYVYHKLEEITVPGFNVKNFSDYAFKSDEYYIVVAAQDNYSEMRDVLIAGGYEPVKDFIYFCPIAYKKVWHDSN